MFTFIYSMQHGFRVEFKSESFPEKNDVISKINEMINADDSFIIENGYKRLIPKLNVRQIKQANRAIEFIEKNFNSMKKFNKDKYNEKWRYEPQSYFDLNSFIYEIPYEAIQIRQK